MLYAGDAFASIRQFADSAMLKESRSERKLETNWKNSSNLIRGHPTSRGRPEWSSWPNYLSSQRDKRKEALDNLFCSELITEAYQAAGLLPEETLNSNDILPSMFAPGKSIDEYLVAQSHGFRLGEIEVFKAPETPLHTAIIERRAKLKSGQARKEDIETNNLTKAKQ